MIWGSLMKQGRPIQEVSYLQVAVAAVTEAPTPSLTMMIISRAPMSKVRVSARLDLDLQMPTVMTIHLISILTWLE